MRDGQVAGVPRDGDSQSHGIECGIAATRSALLLVLMDTRTPGEAWRDTVRAAASVATAAATLARAAAGRESVGRESADRLEEIARTMGSAHGLPRDEAIELIHRAILGCGAEVVVSP